MTSQNRLGPLWLTLVFLLCALVLEPRPTSPAPPARRDAFPSSPEEQLRFLGAQNEGDRLTDLQRLIDVEGQRVSVAELWSNDDKAGPRSLLLVQSGGRLAATEVSSYFWSEGLRARFLGRLEGDEVFGVVFRDGGSGGWQDELQLFRLTAAQDLEHLASLRLSETWHASGFDEVCNAGRPWNERSVDFSREGNDLVVSGYRSTIERLSPAGEPLELREHQSPIREVHALASIGSPEAH